MKTVVRVVILVALLLSVAHPARALPIVFIVRHAEKATTGDNDPDLSGAGEKRAEALAQMLKDSALTAIFVSEAKRTQQTAAPVAKATHIAPTVVPARDIPALVDKLRALKGNALVVGHGNTIPNIVKALGIVAPVDIPEDDYNDLFVVTLSDQPQLVRLHYPF